MIWEKGLSLLENTIYLSHPQLADAQFHLE